MSLPEEPLTVLLVLKGIAFMLAGCGIWIAVNAGNLQEFLTAYSRRNQELEQIEILKGRIRQLQHRQQSLASHGAESERLARERLNMHLPGERVIFLKQEDTMETASAPRIATADLPPALPPEQPEPKESKDSQSSKRAKSGEKSSRLKKTETRQ